MFSARAASARYASAPQLNMSTFTVQCCTLMRKNALQRLRTPVLSTLEILFPLLVMAVLPALQALFQPSLRAGETNLASAAAVQPTFSLFAGLALAGTGGRLALASSSASGAAAAARFSADMAQRFPPVPLATLGGGALAGALPPELADLELPGWAASAQVFDSVAALEAYTQGASYGLPGGAPPLYAAIVFNSDAPQLDYTLRFNATDLPTTELYVQGFVNNFDTASLSQYLRSPAPPPSPQGFSNASRLGSFQAPGGVTLPGFHTLQLLVDRWAINAPVAPAALAADKVLQLFGSALAALGAPPSPASPRLGNPFAGLPAVLSALPPPARAALAADVAARLLLDLSYAPQQVDLVPFPTPPFVFDPFFQFALPNLGILLLLGYMPTVIRSVGRIVQEKELRMRESMLSMGLSEAALFSSHFGSLVLTNTLVAVGAAALLGASVYSRSNGGLLFLVFGAWGLALAAQTYLISVFFVRAKVASNLSAILFWLGYFPFIALTPQSGAGLRLAVSTLAPANLVNAWQIMANLEGAAVGLTLDTVSVPARGWSVAGSIAMFFFNALSYLALAFYLEAVLPAAFRDFGVPRSPFFPCTRSYWREVCGWGSSSSSSSSSALAAARAAASAAAASTGAAPSAGGIANLNALREAAAAAAAGGGSAARPPAQGKYFEAPDADLLAKEAAGRAVLLRGLRKEFDTPDGVKVAVDGVDLTLHEGQITCLLGHNGAGKTTTISMLTGLIPATAGTASVFGASLENMAAVRRHCGVCPQQDVLWPDLTVQDHLRLFAAIKGVPGGEVEGECAKALALVGLTEKRDVRSAVLSGGQKRKLHVAIAFMGGSRLIILDEPTSGMDPYSRRSTWQMLQGARAGRVILLTTHFMDEADVLGDKVIILSAGRVECCGSPLFLKKAFDIGYSLTLVRAAEGGGEAAAAAAAPPDANDAAILEMVRAHVPEATASGAAGMELTLRLPIPSAPKFPPMLRELESQRGRALGVRDMGIHVTSIEDIFLLVSEGKVGASAEVAAAAAAAAATAAAAAGGAPGAGSGKQQQLLPQLELAALNPAAAALALSVASAPADSPPHSPIAAWGEAPSPRAPSPRGAPAPAPSAATIAALHFVATLRKRLQYASRDRPAMACQLCLPVVLLLVGIAILVATLPGPQPPMLLTTQQLNTLDFQSTALGSQHPNVLPAFAFKSGQADSEDLALLLAALAPEAVAPRPFNASQASALDALNATGQVGAGQITAGDSFPLRDWQRMAAFLASDARARAGSTFGAVLFTGPGEGQLLAGQSPTRALSPPGGAPGGTNELTASVFFNTTAFHGSAIFANVLNTAALRRALGWSPSADGAAAPGITTRSFPLPLTPFEKQQALAAATAAFTQIFLSSFFSLAPTAVQFVVRERQVGQKHMQLLSGLSLPVYWAANFAFDAATFAAVGFLLIGILAASGSALTSTAFNRLGALCALVFSYVLSACGFSYLFSHLFSDASSAGGLAVLFNLLQFGASLAMSILALAPGTCGQVPAISAGLQVLPFFALGQGLTNIGSLEQLPLQRFTCDASRGAIDPTGARYTVAASALDASVAGAPIAYLLLSAAVYLALAVAVDVALADMRLQKAGEDAKQRALGALGCCRGAGAGAAAAAAAAPAKAEDADVAAEAARIRAAPLPSATPPAAAQDAIVFSDLRKTFSGKVAVDNLTFGVPRGEVFGFLGINGAGKSSALKMLTGDAAPTSGTARVLGADIVLQSSAARARLGYCAQTDALLDLLTAREHLALHAALRGVAPAAARGALVERTLAQFGLAQYANKLAGSLSGGNKRKLGLALALIGAPPIVILDEPSTGVDPVAKRAMWGLVSRAASAAASRGGGSSSGGASVILTTHSMEEVEALCTRIGIMVGGRLRCLGSAQHLRNVHGAGWSAELRVAAAGEGAVAALVGALGAGGVLGARSGSGAAAGEAWLPSASFPAAAAALGGAARAEQLAPGRDGWALAAAAAASGAPGSLSAPGVPAQAFCAWWAEQDAAEAAVAYVTSAACFPGAALVERQGCVLKFRVPPLPGVRLSDLFERAEGARQRFGGEDAAITLSQTTLESVFNALAAQQEAEVGVAAGFRAAGAQQLPGPAGGEGAQRPPPLQRPPPVQRPPPPSQGAGQPTWGGFFLRYMFL